MHPFPITITNFSKNIKNKKTYFKIKSKKNPKERTYNSSNFPRETIKKELGIHCRMVTVAFPASTFPE